MNTALLDALAADGFGHYCAGFIDGEGCFSIKQTRVHHPTGSIGYMCHFAIQLRVDDRAILETCAARTGLGCIRSYACRSPSQPKAYWAISKRAECISLTQVLDRFPLRAKKARDFAIWREAVHEWTTVPRPRGGRAGSSSDWTRMAQFKHALESTRAFTLDR